MKAARGTPQISAAETRALCHRGGPGPPPQNQPQSHSLPFYQKPKRTSIERRKMATGDKIERHTSRHVTERHTDAPHPWVCTHTHPQHAGPCTATPKPAGHRAAPRKRLGGIQRGSFPTCPQAQLPFLSPSILPAWERTDGPSSVPSWLSHLSPAAPPPAFFFGLAVSPP